MDNLTDTNGTNTSNRYWVTASIIVLIVAAIVIAYFLVFKQTPESDNNNVAYASKFGTYDEVPVNINPSIPAYEVQPDLSNVSNVESGYFNFSDDAKELLAQNAFVVQPAANNEFFTIYEKNRYSYVPNFITTDSMLHNYHLMFDHLLKQLEEEKLANELKKLNQQMLTEALEQYNTLKGTDWENAAKRNVGFFTVGSKLLDSSVEISAIVSDEVNQELQLIDAHQGISKSAVMNIGYTGDTVILTPQGPQPLEQIKEDYSQYIPRGHYDKTDQLKAYFKSMMWYGRLTFRLKSEDEIKSGILITMALNENNNKTTWNNIYEPINFFVGKSDDISYYDFQQLFAKTYGADSDIDKLSDDSTFDSFVKQSESLSPPMINSMPIFEASWQEDREEEIKGFRFMGQRFTIDASIFQRLIYREVGDKTVSCSAYDPKDTGCLSGARCLPKGLDIVATLGSGEALNILEVMGETDYACYEENMDAMSDYLSSLSTDLWTQNLYWGWLYQLKPLLEVKSTGYPTFMQNLAWVRKDINTFLGSWSELKHDTILYAKQVYAELGAGPPAVKDDRGYVEPRPYVFARLASLLKLTQEGLIDRGLLSDSMKDNLIKMEELALSLKTIAEKELNGVALSDDDYELIKTYGGQLEHFWLEVNKDEPQYQELGQMHFLDQNPAAIVSDVASDPNGSVLEEATGKISNIYVVVPVDGELRIAKGGVYSYYEFTWPLSDRLTDTAWRELLKSDQAPELPEWTDVFVAQ